MYSRTGERRTPEGRVPLAERIRKGCVLLNIPLCLFSLIGLAVMQNSKPRNFVEQLMLMGLMTPPVGLIGGMLLKRSSPAAAAIIAAVPVLFIAGLFALAFYSAGLFGALLGNVR